MSLDTPVLAYFWGDDGWAVDRAVIAVAKDLERDSGAAPDRWRVNGRETTTEAIAEHVATAPMFGGGTLAVVTDPGQLLRSKAGKEAVERLLLTVAPGNALVFVEVGDGEQDQINLGLALGDTGRERPPREKVVGITADLETSPEHGLPQLGSLLVSSELDRPPDRERQRRLQTPERLDGIELDHSRYGLSHLFRSG